MPASWVRMIEIPVLLRWQVKLNIQSEMNIMRNWTRQERIALVALIVGFITAIAYDELRCLLGLIDCVSCSRYSDADVKLLFARVFLLLAALGFVILLVGEYTQPGDIFGILFFILLFIITSIWGGSDLINSCS